MSFVLFIVLLVIIWQLDAIRRNTDPLTSDEERRARRERWHTRLWGRSE
jgi:hypothetical protein